MIPILDFNETDKKKKKGRRVIPENPANLSPERLSELEETVKAALNGVHLSCPIAWAIARKAGVPKIAVGALIDKLGVRVTDCQIGCFKVDKTLYDGPATEKLSDELLKIIDDLNAQGKLTCAKTFELAKEFKVKPLTIGNETIARGIKIRECQLGCF